MSDRGYDSYQKPSSKIYLSNLNMDTTEDDLRKKFSQFGSIVDVTLKHRENGITFAFVEYDTGKSAQQAVDEMNREKFLDKQLKVEIARGKSDKRDYKSRGNNDRPKDCFNCHELGHFARDCPKPRQPREFNKDREYRGERYRNDSYRGERKERGHRDREGYRDREERGFRDREERGNREREYKRRKYSRSRSRSVEKKRRYRSKSKSSNSEY